MLRSEIPTARIMTFDYDSTWTSNAPQLLLESLGEDLIRSLHDVRHDQQRPVVFVAHGFGGLVVQDVCQRHCPNDNRKNWKTGNNIVTRAFSFLIARESLKTSSIAPLASFR